jgi:amino acid transporter
MRATAAAAGLCARGSRIPYAAARGRVLLQGVRAPPSRKGFPSVSLIVLGLISIVACLFSLGVVIDALIATRILVQFIGQAAGVMLLRRTRPDMPRPYRIWLYPVPTLVALVAWLFIFVTTDVRLIAFGVGIVALGVVCFLGWSRRLRQWPFQP